MSGIALIYMKNDVPVDSLALENMMNALAHRGPDGGNTLVFEPLGLGHQQFWTTPEEVGERQPLVWEELIIAFDGRIDNRVELLTALDLHDLDDRQMSDATLVLEAYRRWGEICFSRLLGPFAVVIYNHQERQVICARDPLGDRTLFYHINSDFVLVASEEQALLTHTAVTNRLDEESIFHYYAALPLRNGSTMFADIKEVPQGSQLTFSQKGCISNQYWSYGPTADIRYKADAEYAEHFLDLLKKSVACRLRSPTPVAVLMSGGLDSTSVAAVASNLSAAPVTTVSWVFDELNGADERVFIDACNAHLQTTPLLIKGDDGWPLADANSWPVNPNHPYCDLYERLFERAYVAIAERGIRPLLTGSFGDYLYIGAEYWIADLLQEGRVWEAFVNWRAHSRNENINFYRTDPGLRHLARSLLNRIPGGQRIRPTHAQPLQRSWLTPIANQQLLTSDSYSPTLPSSVRRLGQFRSLYNVGNARYALAMGSNAARFGVEPRDPYHDRRLLEFALAIPAHQLFSGRKIKQITRRALQGLLPEQVRLRTHVSSLSPLYDRGIAERELPQVLNILRNKNVMWPKFINADLLPIESIESFQKHIFEISDFERAIIWNCITFELWHAQINRRSQAEVMYQ